MDILRYVLHELTTKITKETRMTTLNLAIMLAPNLFHLPNPKAGGERDDVAKLQGRISIVELLLNDGSLASGMSYVTLRHT